MRFPCSQCYRGNCTSDENFLRMDFTVFLTVLADFLDCRSGGAVEEDDKWWGVWWLSPIEPIRPMRADVCRRSATPRNMLLTHGLEK